MTWAMRTWAMRTWAMRTWAMRTWAMRTWAMRGRGLIRLLVGLVLALAILREGVAAWGQVRLLRAKPQAKSHGISKSDGIPKSYGILMPGPLRPPRSFTATGTP